MKRSMRVLAIVAGLLIPTCAWPASNVLTWQDNAGNEANFHIERGTVPDVASCPTAAVSIFTQIATVGANVTTFQDSAVTEGVAYCYRVKASNPAGSSGYTNQAGRLVPFSIPVSPSALGVTGGP